MIQYSAETINPHNTNRLSIITINFNHAAGLAKTIESVVSQTFTDYEYIIIDGGSTDQSVDIIKKSGDHIKYWVSEPDRGVYHAMNKGITKATGEYCYFLNSGDYLIADTVLGEVFGKSSGESILYGNMIHGGINTVEPGLKEIRFSDFFVGSIYHQSAFIKKELFNRVGMYNEDLKIVSDWEFFMKAIFLDHCTYRYLDVHIALYETGGLSFKNPEENLRERYSVLQRYFPLFIKDYEELKKYKYSDFAGIHKAIENSPGIRMTLSKGLSITRFIKFKILRKSY